MQNRTDDIRRHARLVLLHHLKLTRQNPRVLHHDVQPLESHRALGKEPDGLVVREVELPYLDDARAAGRLLNGLFRRLAFFEVPDREDDFGGVEADEVAGGFEAEAGVAAGYDDGLVGVFLGGVLGDYGGGGLVAVAGVAAGFYFGLAGFFLGGVWGGEEELGAHEREGFLYVWHFGGFGVGCY